MTVMPMGPLEPLAIAPPIVSDPLLLTVRLSFNTTGALRACVPSVTVIVAPLPELFKVNVLLPVPLSV